MRKSPLSKEQLALCERLKRLRINLYLDRTMFAAACDMTRAQLVNREKQIAPWKKTELKTVAEFISLTIDTATAALADINALAVHGSDRNYKTTSATSNKAED